MKKFMILSLVGKDRPGIVEDVSTLLFDLGANIEDSRMAALGGCFSIMALFSTHEQQLEQIETGLQTFKNLGFAISLYEAQDPSSLKGEAAVPIKLEVQSMDHPGIVQKVVRIFKTHDANIHSLNTTVISAPLTGAPLFNLYLEAYVPAEVQISTIKSEIQGLATELNLDLNFIK